MIALKRTMHKQKELYNISFRDTRLVKCLRVSSFFKCHLKPLPATFCPDETCAYCINACDLVFVAPVIMGSPSHKILSPMSRHPSRTFNSQVVAALKVGSFISTFNSTREFRYFLLNKAT